MASQETESTAGTLTNASRTMGVATKMRNVLTQKAPSNVSAMQVSKEMVTVAPTLMSVPTIQRFAKMVNA